MIARFADPEPRGRQFRATATPLWYYILKEAKVRHNGLRVGPVGSTIISEVFVGLVHGDHNSFLWQVKNWKPTLPTQTTQLHDDRYAPLRNRHGWISATDFISALATGTPWDITATDQLKPIATTTAIPIPVRI
jgi:hypothetical protein